MVPRAPYERIEPQQHVAIKAPARRKTMNICRKSTFIAVCSNRGAEHEKIASEYGGSADFNAPLKPAPPPD